MVQIIKLMTDYQCFPIWRAGGEIGNIDPQTLPLSVGLKQALASWAQCYDRTLNLDDPCESPGFGGAAEEEAFDAEGRRLWRALQEELGPDYSVIYFSIRDAKTYE